METVEVARLVSKYWPKNQWITAVAVALGESSGRERVINDNPSTGDYSFGLFQINMRGSLGPSRRARWGLRSNEELLDPAVNVRCAYDIYVQAGGWRPWGAYTSGAYKKYGRYEQAQAAVAQLESGGKPQLTYKIQRPVRWRGPLGCNASSGRVHPVRGAVLHIMAGTLWGTDDWFRNHCEANSSADYGVGKDGTILQWVDWTGSAKSWAQGNGNPYWVSIENEGQGGDALTPAQLESNAQIVAHVFTKERVPFVKVESPNARGLGYHAMGGSSWGGHSACPGRRIVAQRDQILARAKALAGEEEELTPEDKKWIDQRIKYYAIRAAAVVATGEDNAAYKVPEDYRAKSIKQMIEEALADR